MYREHLRSSITYLLYSEMNHRRGLSGRFRPLTSRAQKAPPGGCSGLFIYLVGNGPVFPGYGAGKFGAAHCVDRWACFHNERDARSAAGSCRTRHSMLRRFLGEAWVNFAKERRFFFPPIIALPDWASFRIEASIGQWYVVSASEPE